VVSEIIAGDTVAIIFRSIKKRVVGSNLLALTNRALPTVGYVIVLVDLRMVPYEDELVRVPAVTECQVGVGAYLL